jgi:glutamyl-tRNA reductase
MENNNLSKHQYFYSVGLSYKADAEMRVIAYDALAKLRLLNKQKRGLKV